MNLSLKILSFLVLTAMMVFIPVNAMATGLIPVMNYQRSDYNFGTQNWDMAQDMLGKVYVANYNGLMVFDGIRWKHYYLPNYSTVRCLYYDSECDRMYAGGTEEFGYFTPDEYSGSLEYFSLTSGLPDKTRNFSEVWDILKIQDNILFRCDDCIFSYKNENIQKLNIPGRISSSSLIGRKIFLGCEDGKIFSLKDGNLGSLREEGKVPGVKIASLLPYDDRSILICTPVSGLFILKEGGITPLNSQLSEELKANQIFCASSQNGIYVFGTVTGGALIWDTNKNETHRINKDSGLKNNTVLNARFDRFSNLWLCLDNGLAYAAIDSPCRKFIGEREFIGTGYTSAVIGDKLLLGTNQGLYLRHGQNSGIDNVKGHKPLLQGQIWSITPNGDDLFISTDGGLYTYDSERLTKVEGLPGVFKTLLLNGFKDKAIASTYDSFHFLQKYADGWHDTGRISGSNSLKGDFLIDDYNRVWMSHWQRGIYMLPFNINAFRFTSCTLFSKNTGLPADDNNTFCLFEGNPISSTYTGIFNLYPESQKAIGNEEINALITPGRKGHLKELADGFIALIDEDGLLLINRTPDGRFEKKEISGPGLYHEIIPGFTDIRAVNNDEIMVPTQSGFTMVDLKSSSVFPHGYKPFISNIYANQDSLVYRSPMAPEKIGSLELPAHLNSLKFELAYPECHFGEKTEFSTYLENFDNEWSPFSPETSREYTRLADGKYVLHLRVKDNYSGKVLESSFGFVVNPPWFRTLWAKGLYTVISFLILILLFASVRKKMTGIRQRVEKRKEKELEEIRKESERETMRKDMEIAGLKNEQLEQEIKFKSDELSATTMSLISKNEILREIGTEISKIKKMASEGSVASIQKNLSRLQASIEENITKDAYWNAFNKNFDIVYGDYMKRLLKLHPDLTQSEKRLCCYIRMGLQSKEIAPLINISFKSVEMSRYRLRKKINLSNDEKLSEYLAGI